MSLHEHEIAVPTKEQITWSGCEVGILIHCDIEIFQPEWRFIVDGKVQDPPSAGIFNPRNLDTDQWVRAAKAAGATYIVLTAKHVTGFTLFPDPEYDYSVMNSPWREGKGDVIADFVASCRKHGIKPGLYYSVEANAHLGIHKGSGNMPTVGTAEWDEFTALVTRHLSLIWSRYGDLFEIWFDGGLLKDGPDYLGLLNKYQPRAITFQGPAEWPHRIRWVGNERGTAPYPCWSTTGFRDHDFDGTEELAELGTGDPDGPEWVPAETDVPIRFMQWLWRPDEDYLVAPPDEIMRWYMESVGRNSNLLLGVVIDDRGLVPDADIRSMTEFGRLVKERFSNPIARISGKTAELLIQLEEPRDLNHVVLMEDIKFGHRVREYNIEGMKPDGGWFTITGGTAIGHKRIIEFATARVSKVRVTVTKYVAIPVILTFEIHDLPPLKEYD